MTIVCGICRDLVTERPQALKSNDDLIISALRCGHVFHHVCVRQWFHCTAEMPHPNRTDLMTRNWNKGTCPVCKKQCLLSKSLRIFPTGDETCDPMVELKKDLDSVVDRHEQLTMDYHGLLIENQKLMKDLDEMRAENHRLAMKLVDTKGELRSVSADYIKVAKKLCDSIEARQVRRQAIGKANGHK